MKNEMSVQSSSGPFGPLFFVPKTRHAAAYQCAGGTPAVFIGSIVLFYGVGELFVAAVFGLADRFIINVFDL